MRVRGVGPWVAVGSAQWRGLVDLPFAEYLTWAANMGADVVDLAISAGWPDSRPGTLTFSRADVARIRAAMGSAGVEIVALGGPDDFAQVAEAGMAEHVALAVDLGAPAVMLMGGRLKPGLTSTELARLVVEGVGHVAAYARTRGVLLALENTSHLAEPELLVRIVEDVGSPAVRLLLDTSNLLQASGDPQTAMRGIALLAPLVVHTHLGNGRGQGEGYRPTPLAEGALDMPAVLDLLGRAGYQGALCTQYEGPDDTESYARDVAFLRGQCARR